MLMTTTKASTFFKKKKWKDSFKTVAAFDFTLCGKQGCGFS